MHQVQGDTVAALQAFTSTAEACLSLDMQLAATAARRRCGELLGGDEGRRMVAETDDYMAGQGIRDPVEAELHELLAPGGRVTVSVVTGGSMAVGHALASRRAAAAHNCSHWSYSGTK